MNPPPQFWRRVSAVSTSIVIITQLSWLCSCDSILPPSAGEITETEHLEMRIHLHPEIGSLLKKHQMEKLFDPDGAPVMLFYNTDTVPFSKSELDELARVVSVEVKHTNYSRNIKFYDEAHGRTTYVIQKNGSIVR